MEGDLLIGVLVGLGVLGLISILTKNKIISIFLRIAFSTMMLVMMNCLLPHYIVGINLYTISFSALLGIPGVMTIYLLKIMV
ncbi:MAG: hypothetical protein E7231_07310 [Cellulosilyticum sp.]|nr:hypothetical protein [Cellulosilyticum sp.]